MVNRIAGYILAGYMVLAGISGCKGECRKDPLTAKPLIHNPHPQLFSEVYRSLPETLDGNFMLRYRWDSDTNGSQSGIAQMDSISSELIGSRVSGYRTETDSLLLRIEDNLNGITDTNGDGTKDYTGRITRKNRRAITDFSGFHGFATGLLEYEDAVQNTEFYVKENIVDIDGFEVFGIGNTGLYQSLPRIGSIRADVIIRYKDGSIDTIVFDTFSTPISLLINEDLDKLDQYFSSNPNGIFANTRVFVFTNSHTQNVTNILEKDAKELKRFVMDESLKK